MIEILAGPVIGAVIGYCTNYIAVKMLFRPLKPIKIGDRTLPFTPGIIPRGQSRIARALGEAVGEHLLTKEDICGMLLAQETKETVVEAVTGRIRDIQDREDTLEEFLGHYVDREDYDSVKEHLEEFVTEKIGKGLEDLDVGTIIAEEGAKEVREKFSGSMVSMFLNDDLIRSIAVPIGNKVGEYIRENGREKIRPLVVGEIAAAENKPVAELMDSVPLKDEKIRELVEDAYVTFVTHHAEEIAGKFHVEQVVEDKVNQMDVLEVEHLLLGVMKKELNAVVNLGALIGFLIGLLNLLF